MRVDVSSAPLNPRPLRGSDHDGGPAPDHVQPQGQRHLDQESHTAGERFSLAIGYLRACITLLVVAHHAALAYADFAPSWPPPSLLAEPRFWLAMPVVDSRRSAGFSLFAGFNDAFFMSLMFFLSGLFTWTSVARKGSRTYLRDRVRRLGMPFAVSAALLAPLAYATTYVASTATATLGGFLDQWLALGMWPAGPAWFLWVLLAFDVLIAGVFALTGGRLQGSRLTTLLAARPLRSLAFLVGASALVYIPLSIAFHPLEWAVWGPFTVQTSRALHYALYFAIGAAIGANRPERGLLAPDGLLARRWLLWPVVALVTFALLGLAIVVAAAHPQAPYLWATITGTAFALNCAACSVAFLALFLRFVRNSVPLLESLRANAYGIYLLHYAAVAWIQYALLGARMPAPAKAAIVMLGATLVAWALTATLRRVKIVSRVI